jgi:hypothetical protein
MINTNETATLAESAKALVERLFSANGHSEGYGIAIQVASAVEQGGSFELALRIQEAAEAMLKAAEAAKRREQAVTQAPSVRAAWAKHTAAQQAYNANPTQENADVRAATFRRVGEEIDRAQDAYESMLAQL